MKIGYIAIPLMAGLTLYLFAEARAQRPAVPAMTVATAETMSFRAEAPAAAGTALHIVHPGEGERLPGLARTFVFGSADPRGELKINGKPVVVHPGGGFITMVELSSGTFVINAELAVDSATYSLTRSVTVNPPVSVSPVSPLTIEYIRPQADCELLPGDEIVVSCKGSPGMEASFSIERVKGDFPMVESQPGIYRGVYAVGGNDKLRDSNIRVTLSDRDKGDKETRVSENKLSLFNTKAPVMAEVTADNAVLRAGPSLSPGDAMAYVAFPPKGTQLRVTGRRGNELRIRLSAAQDAWITKSDVRMLPEGTPPAREAVPNIRVIGRGRTTEVRFPLGRRIPFAVIPGDNGEVLDITFFGAVSNTDIIVYPSSGSAVEQVRWFQDDPETYRLRVCAPPDKWWGYDARYEENEFVFELRSPPEVIRSTMPLAGITIAVDPGHSPDTGAMGPTGFLEKDANLAIALSLKEKLAAKGATVVMTRSGTGGAALYERPKTAYRQNADILVSVHNNALPEGGDPFAKNGYGVYYYHPVSRALARDIHAEYGKRFGSGEMSLRDDGLYYDNLAIPRTTQMPSVLTESAYMIVPREEALLKTVSFQDTCAEAITAGITRYVHSVTTWDPPKPVKKKKKRPAAKSVNKQLTR